MYVYVNVGSSLYADTDINVLICLGIQNQKQIYAQMFLIAFARHTLIDIPVSADPQDSVLHTPVVIP